MTKNGIVFIILIASVISIMLIAVFGTLPEGTSDITIETIEFVDHDGLNEDGEKVKDVKGIITENETSIMIRYQYSPHEADGQIVITVSDPNVSIQHDLFAKEIYLYYSAAAIQNELTVTVTIKDQRTSKQDMMILLFKTPDIIIVPDL